MNNTLIISGIALILFGLYGFYKLLKQRGMNNQHIDFLKSILDTLDFISQEFDLTLGGELVQIIEIMVEVLDYVERMDKFDTYPEKKSEIMKLTRQICLELGVDFGDEFIFEVIDRIADYFIAQNISEDLDLQRKITYSVNSRSYDL